MAVDENRTRAVEDPDSDVKLIDYYTLAEKAFIQVKS